MKKKIFYLIFIPLLFLVSECMATDYVTMVFHKLPANQKLTFMFDDSVNTNKDLEYEFYKEKLKKKLAMNQFTEDSSNPNLFIHFTYGILGDSSRATGVERSFFLGRLSTTAFSRKTIGIKMYDKNKNMIYQSETVSEEGDKDDLFDVYDDMLDSLFKKFPGESGTKRD